MARAWARIEIAMVCTVLSAPWLAAGPAQADLGDPVDAAVDGVGAVQDEVEGTVGQVAHSPGTLLEDAQRKATEPASASSQQEEASGTHDGATEPSQAAAEPRRDTGQVGGSTQQTDPAALAADSSANAPSPRPKAHGHSTHRPPVPGRGARQVAVPAPRADPPCRSGSLAARDLRRCARAGTPFLGQADTSLPGLGGVPRILLPAGLLMVAMGLVLVACGRRRSPSIDPAT